MSTGLSRLLSRRFTQIGQSFGGPRKAGSGGLKSALVALAVVIVLVVGIGASLMMSIDDSESADGDVARASGQPAAARQVVNQERTGKTGGMNLAAVAQPASTTADQVQANAAPEPTAPEDKPTTSIEPSAVNGLRISSQSWRRGGLGSKALVTFTVRNDNPYAVKNVEIACAFSRRDGSHLTDRTRIVPGEVGKKRRKTFAAVHVGFVNVNASKAKCALVAASKI
jgi:hypothetical protein